MEQWVENGKLQEILSAAVVEISVRVYILMWRIIIIVYVRNIKS